VTGAKDVRWYLIIVHYVDYIGVEISEISTVKPVLKDISTKSQHCKKWVSEPLLFNTNSAIFHDDEVCFVLDQHFSWILIVLAPWNTSPRIDMSSHPNMLSRFRANQSLLFLLNATCLAEK
jgi:hypothetical protein